MFRRVRLYDTEVDLDMSDVRIGNMTWQEWQFTINEYDDHLPKKYGAKITTMHRPNKWSEELVFTVCHPNMEGDMEIRASTPEEFVMKLEALLP